MAYSGGTTISVPISAVQSGAKRMRRGFSRRIRSTATSGRSYPGYFKEGTLFCTQDRQLHQKPLLLDYPALSPQDQ